MALVAALLELGPFIAKAVLALWLQDKSLATDAGTDVLSVLSRHTKDILARNRGDRLFADIGERIALSLQPVFEQEGLRLAENERVAIAYAVSTALRNTPITVDLVLSINLDPSVLAKQLFESPNQEIALFSANEMALYRRIIIEISALIVDTASKFPAFTEKAFAEILKSQDILIQRVEFVLEELKRIREQSVRTNSEYGFAQFESDYRRTVIRKLDEIRLVGFEGK
jgi:hypothetical protein